MKSRVLKGIAMAALVVVVFVFGALAGPAEKPATKPAAKPAPVRTGTTQHQFRKKICRMVKGQYLLFLPETYGRGQEKSPLILFLHGSGERGTNLSAVGKHGPPKVAPTQKNFPFIVLSPQCPKGKWWTDPDVTAMVMAILDDVCEKYRVDRRRIYLTGLSMGGFGAWSLASQYPNRFAALVPICGGGNPYLAKRLKNIPTRVYHGQKDRSVPLSMSQQMVMAMKQTGGNVEFKVFPELGHICWEPAYRNPELYSWLLQHKRVEPAKK